MTQTKQTHKTDHRSHTKQPPAQQTFMDHIRELQSRLFYIAIVFLIMSGTAYPFFKQIAHFIVAPLGKQELVYLTPGGAFSFIIQVCLYVGFVASLPVIIYHLYQFLSPVMPHVRQRRLIQFTVASFTLAISGVAFAYYVSLPAALYFLTNFNIADINPMLTIDSYFSFAMAYLIAGAILFQLPLILMIIDGISPLTPRKLMGYQRHVILGSVIIAAIISPTPDMLNQLLLAAPLVVMYQLGIVLIALQHKKRKGVIATTIPVPQKSRFDDSLLDDLFDSKPSLVVTPKLASPVVQKIPQPDIMPLKVTVKPVTQSTKTRSIDGFRPRTQQLHVPNREVSQHLRRNVAVRQQRRSVDGIMLSVRPTV